MVVVEEEDEEEREHVASESRLALGGRNTTYFVKTKLLSGPDRAEPGGDGL